MTFDCIVIGSGYAGCTASIYLSMAKKQHVVFSGNLPGGLISTTGIVANHPGLNGFNGGEIARLLMEHADSFSECTFVYDVITSFEKQGEEFILYTESGTLYKTKSIIVATGSSHKKLPIQDVDGVMYCAVCDGFLFKDKVVAVVGGGNSAFESLCYLAAIAKKVYLIHRSNSYKAFPILVEKAEQYKNVTFMNQNEVGNYVVNNERQLKALILKDGRELMCNGVFIAIGHYPNTKFLRNVVKLDEEGYIIVDENLQSSVRNIFAAGDVINNPWRQGVVAAADGCKAALSLIKQLD